MSAVAPSSRTASHGTAPNRAARPTCPKLNGVPAEPTASPWRREGSRVVYENAWIRVREDEVLQPDGQPGIYGVVHMKHWAVGIVPLASNGDTLLVGQYRYPLEQYSWEIPEGGGSPSDTPLASAQRELREETGVSAERWAYLGEAHLSNSVTDEVGCLFLAEELSFGAAEPEGTEDLRLRRVPLAYAVRMALSGEISDALSIVGLLRVENFLRAGRRLDFVQRSFPGLGRSVEPTAD